MSESMAVVAVEKLPLLRIMTGSLGRFERWGGHGAGFESDFFVLFASETSTSE